MQNNDFKLKRDEELELELIRIWPFGNLYRINTLETLIVGFKGKGDYY